MTKVSYQQLNKLNLGGTLGVSPRFITIYHGNPRFLHFFGDYFTHILEVLNLHFSWVLGVQGYEVGNLGREIIH